ncbi:MAG: hypothetical protein K1X74_08195 [Pirellulales bacterium]|nr:hypothetical protein [Pirellulales bacterium]
MNVLADDAPIIVPCWLCKARVNTTVQRYAARPARGSSAGNLTTALVLFDLIVVTAGLTAVAPAAGLMFVIMVLPLLIHAGLIALRRDSGPTPLEAIWITITTLAVSAYAVVAMAAFFFMACVNQTSGRQANEESFARLSNRMLTIAGVTAVVVALVSAVIYRFSARGLRRELEDLNQDQPRP